MTNMEFIQCASLENLAKFIEIKTRICPPQMRAHTCPQKTLCAKCWEEWLMKEKEESSNV